MAVVVSPKVATSGLILELDAANVKSYSGTGSNWVDLSSNKYAQTITSGFTFNTNYFLANGTTSISTGLTNYPVASYNEAFSLEVWAYIPSSYTWNTTYRCGLLHRGQYTGFHGLTLDIANNTIYFGLRGTTGVSSGSYATITRDTWFNVSATWSGLSGTALANIYVNGSLIQSKSLSALLVDSPSSNTAWNIGYNQVESGVGNYFTGSISNIKIYNRSLADFEVKQNFNAYRGRYGL